MRVTIIAPGASERSVGQMQILAGSGHSCHLYVEEQLSDQQGLGSATCPATFLEEEHVQATALFVFHFEDDPYPLLDTIQQLQHGLVVLDMQAASKYKQAPVYQVDVCIVAGGAQRLSLIESTGLAPERVMVLPLLQDDEQAWQTFFDQAVQGELVQTSKAETSATKVTRTVEELRSILLIRDANVDQTRTLKQVQQAIFNRQTAGGYGPDVTTLGPKTLHPRSIQDNLNEESHDPLLRIQKLVDDLSAKSRLQEPDFNSDVPFVGPFIVAVRRFWNWMSAKWYVRDWMGQQAAFNARVTSTIEDLLWVLEANKQHVHELEAELQRLRFEERNDR